MNLLWLYFISSTHYPKQHIKEGLSLQAAKFMIEKPSYSKGLLVFRL